MTSFVIFGICCAVLMVVFYGIEIWIMKGATHVAGGLGLDLSGLRRWGMVRLLYARAREAWHARRQRHSQTVYVDQLYDQYHPRISAWKKMIR